MNTCNNHYEDMSSEEPKVEYKDTTERISVFPTRDWRLPQVFRANKARLYRALGLKS